MATPSNFGDLQAGFYNAFAQALGFAPGDPFQLIQPSPPLAGGDGADQLLWSYFNAIPPASLTHNTVLSGGNQFLADYQGVMAALLAAPNDVQSVVGPTCWAAYQVALKNGDVKPGAVNFRNWALVNGACSQVAVKGASAIQAAMLDPIFAAQMNVTPYKPAGTEDVDFLPGYTKMVQLLKIAPSRSIAMISISNWNTSTSKSWAQNSSSGFFGLWGGSSSTSSLSQKFASSGVTLQASFGNVLQFAATPGDWYSSSALGLAFNNPLAAPWDPTKPTNWNNTFDSPNGNMQRFCANLIIVNKMNVTVTSQAVYSEQDQTTINQNSGGGLWPFYSAGSSSGSSTNLAFDAQGSMVITITSQAGVPVVVGCTVLPVSQYLGHTMAESEILSARLGLQPIVAYAT